VRSRALGTIEYALYVPRVLRPRRRALGAVELLASLPLATQHGDPELEARLAQTLHRLGVTLAPGLVCETFPQAQRAVLTGRYAAILPTYARDELPLREFDEVRSHVFGPPAKLSLLWHARLERQRPRAAALAAPLVSALAV
jgi:hypothetical protein